MRGTDQHNTAAQRILAHITARLQYWDHDLEEEERCGSQDGQFLSTRRHHPAVVLHTAPL